jgi:hypothetical protein
MSQRVPAECFHPSEFIKEELEARRWSVAELAMRMANGDREQYGIEMLALEMYLEIGPETPGLRLGNDGGRLMAAAFDVSPDLFLNLEKSWLGWRAANGVAVT